MATPKNKLVRRAAWIYSACGLFVIGIAVAYVLAKRAHGTVDPETLCRIDKPRGEQFVVLIDRTDPMKEGLLNIVLEEIASVKDTIPKNAMLSVYLINAQSAEMMSPEFCLCNPGNGDDESWLYKNPKRIRAKWEASFGAPLRAALEPLREIETAESSPILEALGVVTSLQSFRECEARRTIIVYSDMLQNTGWYSHYRDRNFAHPPNAEIGNIAGSLTGVDIRIRYIDRVEYRGLQTEEHRQFWRDALTRLGARSIEILRVKA